MKVENSSTKEIGQLIRKVPLYKLKEKVVNSDNQLDKVWWNRIYQMARLYQKEDK